MLLFDGFASGKLFNTNRRHSIALTVCQALIGITSFKLIGSLAERSYMMSFCRWGG